ncbi:MAG: beta-hydroxyacyl-ACP dehydratase [Spirochaetes bacterium]|nr:beta-hydroxyacyl-ACP dehydratase [Spirochaetota bacterium]
MDYESLLKEFRKKPIVEFNSLAQKTSFNKEDIHKIIPHRDPFLLVDTITGIDLTQEVITGERYISPDEPLFKGHFPDFPVYPGSLQLEMVGQLGLCLHYFIEKKSTRIEEGASPSGVRATRIIGAHFLQPILPDRTVRLIAKKLEYDTFFGTIIGQVISDEKVCSVSISEVCFTD